MSLNVSKKESDGARLPLAGVLPGSRKGRLRYPSGARQWMMSHVFRRFEKRSCWQRFSHPLYQAASGPCSSIPLVTFSGRFFRISRPWVVSRVGRPPLKLDKRGCRPHSRLAPSPRPKASRGEADATAKAEGGSAESSFQKSEAL